MSIIDKAIAAITPPVSDEKRQEAHAKARSVAERGDWLSQILDHHEQIEQAFAATKAASTADERRAAQKRLGVLLNGHAMAEEAVIYPALAHEGKQGHANTAYTEQAAAKMQLAALETLDPMSEDFLDKLGHLEGAVQTHVYQEESDWFPSMKSFSPAEAQAHATARYQEEYGRLYRRWRALERFCGRATLFLGGIPQHLTSNFESSGGCAINGLPLRWPLLGYAAQFSRGPGSSEGRDGIQGHRDQEKL